MIALLASILVFGPLDRPTDLRLTDAQLVSPLEASLARRLGEARDGGGDGVLSSPWTIAGVVGFGLLGAGFGGTVAVEASATSGGAPGRTQLEQNLALSVGAAIGGAAGSYLGYLLGGFADDGDGGSKVAVGCAWGAPVLFVGLGFLYFGIVGDGD